MSDKSYIMYHCHSDYSLLDSCTKYQEYIDLAVRDGSRALSISEHGKPLNWTEKWNACRKAGLKYIHSVEIYLTRNLDEKVRDNYHTVLMARNYDGVKEINKLIKLSTDDNHFYYVNRITFDEFLNLSDNIITTSACLASPLNKLDEDDPYYDSLVRKYDFLEVQGHNCEDQIDFNRRLLELSKKYNKPLIAGTDTHSSSKYKAECRSILLKAKHKSYGDEDQFDLTYKTYDELVDMFRTQGAIPEEEYIRAIDNTNLLYDMVDDFDLDVSIKYPILYGSREKDSEMFVKTIDRKFKEKLESGIIPESQRQAFEDSMKEELRVFQKLHMDGFMLSMSELISWCKDNNISVGTSRGSVGGSRIAYVTDIIDLNPETWHTIFSRFANEDREEIGDIDIDVIDKDRPAIFNHIINKFGERKTARVASFGTMQVKGAIDDIGRALATKWKDEHPNNDNNPWALNKIEKIKNEFDKDEESTKKKYNELFYYFDGLFNTKISQSVHPAGMVISPITLDDNYGTFNKDGENCLLLDMENIHDFTGLAKYDFLVLKTVQLIRDTCDYIGVKYPRTYEINWNDENVWKDMLKSPVGIFQFEGQFAFDSLKKFNTASIFDMSLVTACIRPTGASYRDDLLSRKIHHNPSVIIDELLKNNLGYLVYQEDTIAFLQQICGLSGSASDNVRRSIGRKQRDRLETALPQILEGYCSKSNKPRAEAEQEAKEFLQVIEDSASYQFGYNHSIGYCLLGYLCAYYRYYYPMEFLTAFLNDAANDDDTINGTKYANMIGIKITTPKYGISKSNYSYDKDLKTISKGLSSVKYLSSNVADELYELSKNQKFDNFVDLLYAIVHNTSLDTRQVDILIKIDFFSDFGNQRELLYITDYFYNMFKKGESKQISRDYVDGTYLESVVKKYASGETKSGQEAKSYKILDIHSILVGIESKIKSSGIKDLSIEDKVKNFAEATGYVGYTSGVETDRRKLYVLDIYDLKRKADGKKFGYSFVTKSIGSGKESRFTVLNRTFDMCPVKKGDIIMCTGWAKEGQYYKMTSYSKID